MALAYTAPTWENGTGQGISASALQSISNCLEGLVQGSDKAIHSLSINGSALTLVYADGSEQTFEAVNIKGISNVVKTTVGRVDTYTMVYSDGTTYSFDVKNGKDGSGIGDMLAEDYDPDGIVESAGGIVEYINARIIGAIEGVY